MKINYGEIVSTGLDYSDACYRYHRKYSGSQYISHKDPDLYEAYHRMERAERVMTVVCYVLEMPTDIPVRAARIMEKAYRRAASLGHDYGNINDEIVVKSLLANQ